MNTSKKFVRTVSAVLCLLMLLCSASGLAETYATVRGGALNLRQKASTNAKVLGQYPTGTWVTILESGDTWSKVKVNGKTGFMKSKYLAPVSHSTMYVTTNTGVGLNLRNKPSMSGDILASFKPGTPVTVITKGSAWYYVSVDGLKGYMGSQYLTTNASGKKDASISATLYNPNGGSIVNFRTAPGLNSSIIAAYPVGTKIKVLEKNKVWCRVEINGQRGYVSAYFIKF